MNKKDLLKILKKCAANSDCEMAHGDADDALLEFIGDPEIIDAFEKIEKWYA